jgi:cytochrome c oxidase subunit 2
MLSHVIVESPADFEKFIERIKDWTKSKTPLQAGEMLYNTRGCAQCHSIDGTAKIGPTWKDMFGSQVSIAGKGNVLADEDYIRESILYPNAKVVQGFQNPSGGSQMSSFLGQLNDNDIMAIISYMKSISVHFKGDLTPFRQKLKQPTTAPVASLSTSSGTKSVSTASSSGH